MQMWLPTVDGMRLHSRWCGEIARLLEGSEGGRIIFQNIGIIEVTNEVIEVMI